METTEGERLRAFLEKAAGARHGWVTDLAEAAHVRRQTVYVITSVGMGIYVMGVGAVLVLLASLLGGSTAKAPTAPPVVAP